MVLLPDGEKSLRIRVTIPACDGRTDGQTDILRRHSPRYAYESRGKMLKESIGDYVICIDRNGENTKNDN